MLGEPAFQLFQFLHLPRREFLCRILGELPSRIPNFGKAVTLFPAEKELDCLRKPLLKVCGNVLRIVRQMVFSEKRFPYRLLLRKIDKKVLQFRIALAADNG